MPSVLPLPTSLCLPPGTSPCCTAWVQRCLAAAGVCGYCFSKPRSSSCFVHAGDGTKTSRTTTMESSYVKRSDSKSFSCPFPTASSGCNPGALLLLSRHCPGASRVLPAWHSFCSGPLSFLSLSLQMATVLLFKPNHPTAPHPKRQAGEQRCLWGQPHMVPCHSSACTNPVPSFQCPHCKCDPKASRSLRYIQCVQRFSWVLP